MPTLIFSGWPSLVSGLSRRVGGGPRALGCPSCREGRLVLVSREHRPVAGSAGVVAQGGGDAGCPDQAQDGDGQAQAGHYMRPGWRTWRSSRATTRSPCPPARRGKEVTECNLSAGQDFTSNGSANTHRKNRDCNTDQPGPVTTLHGHSGHQPDRPAEIPGQAAGQLVQSRCQ